MSKFILNLKTVFIGIKKLIQRNKFNFFYFLIFFIIFSVYLFFFLSFFFFLVCCNLTFICIIKTLNINFVFSQYDFVKKYEPFIGNFYFYVLYVFFIRKPIMYSYIFSYSFAYTVLNYKKINFDTDKIAMICFKYIFNYMLGFFCFILQKTLEITEVYESLLGYDYQNLNDFYSTLLIQIIALYSRDLKILKDFKIIFTRDKPIIFDSE